jgi:hypothetical protein
MIESAFFNRVWHALCTERTDCVPVFGTGLLLTTDAAISEIKEEKEEKMPGRGGMGGMGM